MSVKTSAIAAAAALLSQGALAAPSLASRADAASPCVISDYSQVSGCLKSTAIEVNNVKVPAGETLTLEKLAKGTTVTFTGTTSFGYKEWPGWVDLSDRQLADYNPQDGPLLSISGTGVTVTGSGIIDGNGPQYWDGQGSNGGITKPKFFSAHNLDSSTINGITLKNAPIQFMSIQSDDLTISGLTIDNGAASGPNGVAHNTDAFDIGSSNGVSISNTKVNNQDDCVAINSGTNIEMSGMTCNGSHGLSIGSVGGRSNNVVENVSVRDSTITNGQNGLRIKTVSGATGSVSNVTWSGVKMSGITDYGIVIQQDYLNGGPSGTPTNGVTIDGVTVSDVTGSVTSKAQEAYVLCGTGCSNFKFNGVSLTGGSKGSVKGVTIAGYS
ncbi:MAG: hypothetical protein Q9162_004168 [Coniocarpon cinnabarinum]